MALHGLALHWVDSGAPMRFAERLPVVLIHGLGSSGDDWAGHAPAVEAGWRVLAPDLPGHGRTPCARGRLSIDGMAESVARDLDALGVARCHAIGLSLGGAVALQLALAAPRRVASLVVVSGFARLRPRGARAAFRIAGRLALMAVAPMSTVGAYVAGGLFPGPDRAELRAAAAARLGSMSRRGYAAAVAAIGRFDARARLGQIGCPTLVVVGADDRTVPRSAADLLLAGIPRSRPAIVTGAGHAVPWDRPAAFGELAADFLSSVDGAAADPA